MNDSANPLPADTLAEELSFRLSLLRLMTVPHPIGTVNDSNTTASRQLEELGQVPLRRKKP